MGRKAPAFRTKTVAQTFSDTNGFIFKMIYGTTFRNIYLRILGRLLASTLNSTVAPATLNGWVEHSYAIEPSVFWSPYFTSPTACILIFTWSNRLGPFHQPLPRVDLFLILSTHSERMGNEFVLPRFPKSWYIRVRAKHAIFPEPG